MNLSSSKPLSAAIFSFTLLGCAGGKPTSEAPTASAQPAAAKADGELRACMGSLEPAEDGLIDDFEDGNAQVASLAGRDGYWWLARDNQGSQFTTPEGAFAVSDGGADSAKAIHVVGKTVTGSNDAWGVEFGTNFLLAKGGLYDASKYAGVSFRAKASGGPTHVRVSLGDVNTHADAGVCTTCWNHFRKDFTLTDEWQTFTLRFTDLAQRDGWGDPRPKTLTPNELVAVSFAIDGGQAFDVWVDDVKFLACSN